MIEIVAGDSPIVRSFLGVHPNRDDGREPVAAVLHRRGQTVTDAILVYFHMQMGMAVSFIADTPRPWLVLHRCVELLETWLRGCGVLRYTFVIEESDHAYRSIVERWGAQAVARGNGQILYARIVVPAPKGRRGVKTQRGHRRQTVAVG